MPLPWRRARKRATAEPGRARKGEEEGCGRWGRQGRWRDGGLPRSRCYQRGACGWRPGRGSRVLGARVGLRTPLRGDQWTVPLGLRRVPGSSYRRRPLPPPPPTPRTKPHPHPDTRSAAAAKSSAAYRLPAAAPAGKCSPDLGHGGQKEEEASQRGGEEGPEREPESEQPEGV